MKMKEPHPSPEPRFPTSALMHYHSTTGWEDFCKQQIPEVSHLVLFLKPVFVCKNYKSDKVSANATNSVMLRRKGQSLSVAFCSSCFYIGDDAFVLSL